MRQLISTIAVAVLLSCAAAAQAEVTTTVRLGQTVFASGQPLAAGTYQLRITDERPMTPAGTPNESQRWVEFSANGRVVARETAEVFAASERPVGTSSASGAPRAVVEQLKGGEFVRVAVNGAGARYLIHLPTGPQSTPLYQETPSRIELPAPSQPGPTETKPLTLP